MNRWFVAHTLPQAEQRAVLNLRRQGFKAYLPRYRKQRRHARRVDWILAPLFPRYVFIAMDPARPRWRSINGTFGVHCLVCRGDRPASVPDGVVQDNVTREDADGAVALDPGPLRKGDRLRVLAGAFAERVGLFEQMAEADRVVMLLDLLGRQVPVRVPLGSFVVEA